jgi:hypothetical protein
MTLLQHNGVMFMGNQGNIGLVILNGATTTVTAGKPVIFDGINSTGQVVVKYETHGATCSGGNTFAQSPVHKVIGFPEVTLVASTAGIVIYSGVIDIKNLGTITAGGFLKWSSTAGVGARMAEATAGDTGKIRGFWMEAATANGTALAFVAPWMI